MLLFLILIFELLFWFFFDFQFLIKFLFFFDFYFLITFYISKFEGENYFLDFVDFFVFSVDELFDGLDEADENNPFLDENL